MVPSQEALARFPFGRTLSENTLLACPESVFFMGPCKNVISTLCSVPDTLLTNSPHLDRTTTRSECYPIVGQLNHAKHRWRSRKHDRGTGKILKMLSIMRIIKDSFSFFRNGHQVAIAQEMELPKRLTAVNFVQNFTLKIA